MSKMKILIATLLMLIMGMANSQIAGAGVKGTAHDPGIWTFGGETQVCVMCHAPHNGNTQGPLWNRAANNTSYTLYASSTMNAVVGQPGSVSKLCLSCHDGTIGMLDYGGATGSMTLAQAYSCTNPLGCGSVLGTNLSNDHPIGITYDTALATADKGLSDPATKNVTIGSTVSRTGTIAANMLVGGKVECTSCHDVHNIYTVVGSTGQAKGLVKVGMAGSSLCLQCHTK
jgi:hypothetical protein